MPFTPTCRARRSGFIQLANQVVLFVLTAGSTMVLARLLAPSDYWLLAMVAPLLLLAGMFLGMGLPMATVQREQLAALPSERFSG